MDPRGATKYILVDSGAKYNYAGPELMDGAYLLNLKLFQAGNHNLILKVREKPIGRIAHMIAGTNFMSQYRAIVDFGALQAFFCLGEVYYVVPLVGSSDRKEREGARMKVDRVGRSDT